VHGRPHRQRPALPRLRHPRRRRTCEFEEIAHLLVHGKLPNLAELAAYKAKLKALRGLPNA
jgi:citrate synthase